MKKNLLIITLLALVIVSTSAFVIYSNNGKAGYTGFAGELNCNSCHGTGGGSTMINVTASPAFVSNQYVPGQSYTISVQVSSQTLSHFGFGAGVLNGTTSTATNAGTITAITGSSQVKTSGTRKNAVHVFTSAGSGMPSSTTFMFKWVAPASGVANIFAIGMAVNNNNNDDASDAAVASQSIALTASSTSGLIDLEKSNTTISVFPNPSNDNITLSYYLASEGTVSATLYSLQGQKIETLFTDKQSVGTQTTTVTYPQELSAGVYLVKLSQNGKLLSERMIIKQ